MDGLGMDGWMMDGWMNSFGIGEFRDLGIGGLDD